MNNEKNTNILEERGEKILLKGEFHNKVFIVGIVLAIVCIVFSSFYLAGENADVFAEIDYIIITVSVVSLFLCVKELILNRKRMLCLTDKRVFGNTGYSSFDIPYCDITNIEEKTKKSFIYGNLSYLYIKTASNTEYKIEQLKNIEKVIQVIKSNRDS
ncbi:MAG: hypothetical protein GX022_02610 [Clostridiaceae bacterium]|nr:hypothetical protein [Clostridiaceae bacterium]